MDENSPLLADAPVAAVPDDPPADPKVEAAADELAAKAADITVSDSNGTGCMSWASRL